MPVRTSMTNGSCGKDATIAAPSIATNGWGRPPRWKLQLRSAVRGAEVLELACGTGLWTQRLADGNRHVTAVDASPETIAINRERVGSANVEYHVADIFSWVPPTTYDVVFFSFWLSHVPPARFEEFWALVRAALKPGGQAFFIDSLPEPTSTAKDHGPIDESGVSRRKAQRRARVQHREGLLSAVGA